jgi:hypothetical protein
MRGQGLEVEVNVDELRTKLQQNRAKHLKEHEKAKKGWAKLLDKELQKLLIDLRDGKSIDDNRLYIKNQKPKHFLREYDEAIDMLGWEKRSSIPIDQEHFRAYIHDEWTWKTTWEASNATYIAAGR